MKKHYGRTTASRLVVPICGEHERHPSWAFMVTKRLLDVTCTDCKNYFNQYHNSN